MGWFRRNEHDEEQLSAYLDGELDARQASTVERHLASCAPCTELLEEMRQTRTLLMSLPQEAPSRSFVLGPEHARQPVQPVAPPRRFTFAMAPAAALAVFVALVLVDVGNFGTTQNDASETLTMRTMQEDAEGDEGQPGITSMAPPSFDAAASPVPEGMVEQDRPAQADGGATAADQPGPEAATDLTTLAGEAEPSEDRDSAMEPIAFDGDGEGGVSTLRVLQVLALIAVLASGFYVFVRPRIAGVG